MTIKVWEAAVPAKRRDLKPLLLTMAGNGFKGLPPEQQPAVLQQLRGAPAR